MDAGSHALFAGITHTKGGDISISVFTDNVEVAKELINKLSLGIGLTLSALFAYKVIKPLIEDAVKKGFGGERDDQEVRSIRPGSLHVLLHCFTDERFLEVLEEFESGKMKERLEKEFFDIGIETEGLKVEIENMEEVNKTKKAINKRLCVKLDSSENTELETISENTEKVTENKDGQGRNDEPKKKDDAIKPDVGFERQSMELPQERSQMNNAILQVEEQNDNKNSEIQQHQEGKNHTNSEIQQEKSHIQQLQEERNHTNNATQKLLRENSDVRNEIRQLREQKNPTSNEVQRLQQKNHNLRDEIQQLREQYNNKSIEIQQLQEEKNHTNGKLQEFLQEKSQMDNDDILQLGEEKSQTSNEVQQLQQENQDLEDEIQQLREENNNKSSEIQELKEEKNHMYSELQELQRELIRMSNEMLQLQKKNDDLMQQLLDQKNRMNSETQERLRQKSQMNNQILQLQEQNVNTAIDPQQLQEEKNHMNSEIQELQQEKSKMNNEILQLREENDNKTCKIQKTQEEKDHMISEMQELRQEKSQLNDDILQLVKKKILMKELQEENTLSSLITESGSVVVSSEILGKGGWGVVYKGDFYGTKVAVKEYYEVILSPHNIQILEREITIASQCRHPNLLQFICATRNNQDHLLIVTELMDMALRTLVEQHAREKTRLEYQEVKLISFDVARGLNYLHSKKQNSIIHRDVSSANVLLWIESAVRRAKISDYGSANFMQVCKTANPGAPLYAAPEASLATQDPKIDVFSYGLLVCEMSICELPFPDQVGRTNQINQIPHAEIKKMVERCTEINPRERPTMQDVIGFWQKME